MRRVRTFVGMPLVAKRAALSGAVLNPWFRRRLHARGLKDAAALARRLGGTGPPTSPADPDVALERARGIESGVRAIGRVAPIGVVCLPRCLTTWTLLRRSGIAAEVVIGVDPSQPGIGAHAWVTVGGVALGESAAHLATLHRFDEPVLG
jgi:hypothetical protein